LEIGPALACATRYSLGQAGEIRDILVAMVAPGTFASFAQALDMITLSQDGNEFTAQGTIQDFDANNVSLSIGCFTHSAKRLSAPGDLN
jgi:hypothetical protein